MSVPKQQLWNARLVNFVNFTNLPPPKDQTPRKVWTPGQDRFRTHGNEKSR